MKNMFHINSESEVQMAFTQDLTCWDVTSITACDHFGNDDGLNPLAFETIEFSSSSWNTFTTATEDGATYSQVHREYDGCVTNGAPCGGWPTPAPTAVPTDAPTAVPTEEATDEATDEPAGVAFDAGQSAVPNVLSLLAAATALTMAV